MPKAFISYSRSDKAFVDEFIRPTLSTLKIETWIDVDNLHGSEIWKDVIQRALNECDYFLLIVTTSAAASPAVRGEVDQILAKKKELLVPILAERVRLDGVDSRLPDIQHVDCVGQAKGRVAALIAKTLFHLNDRRVKSLQEKVQQLSDENDRIKEEIRDTTDELRDLDAQLHQVLDFDGDWRRPPLGEVAPFVPRSDRNVTIVSVLNVKGGVGKSTLTANLAATWWGRVRDPKRVLLVDLDFQQSVTSLCLAAKDRSDMMQANSAVNSLFDENIPATEHLLRSMRRVGRGDGYILASNDSLTKIETQAMAKWLASQTKKDVRFLLRSLLHSAVVQERFDLVLLDCPPRVHTATINALAASDFILIPVLLDLTSADSVPRMLKWVRAYQEEKVCPEIEVLGIVANNKSDRRKELLAREENIWAELPAKCRIAWGGDVEFCKTVLPHSPAIAECANTPGHFACEDPRAKPLFDSLAKELEMRMESTIELQA
jgi:cellulose biosynthesis protein BcsQ